MREGNSETHMKSKQLGSINMGGPLSYAVTLVVLLLASIVSEGRIWAFDWYGFFPWYWTLLLALVGIVVPIALVRLREWSTDRPGDDTKPETFMPVAIIVIVIFVSCYVLLATRTHFLGDGYLLLSRLETGSTPVRPWNIGAYFISDSIHGLLGGSGETRAELAYRLVAWLNGLFFLAATALVAVSLYKCRRDRLIFMTGVASGGFALLFFGYVENYPSLVTLTAVATFLGLLAAAGTVNRWWILLPITVALLVHPFAVALLPGALYLIGRESGLARRYLSLPQNGQRVIWIGAVAVAAVAAIWLYRSSSFLRFSLVPPVTDKFTVEGYTLFSAKHLIDFANLLFQLLPACLTLLWIMVSLRSRKSFASVQYRFLLLILIPSMLIAFLFDPKLGMPRDWDLFAFSGVPLVILLFVVLLNASIKIHGHAAIAVLCIVLNLLVLAPRVVTQVIADTSVSLFKSYIELDPLKNGSGHAVLRKYLEENGRREDLADWDRDHARLFPNYTLDDEGQQLYQQGRYDLAEAKFRAAVACAPNTALSWVNIGACMLQRGEWDSALVYFHISDGLNPFSSETYHLIGCAHHFRGDSAKAMEYYVGAIHLDPANFKARSNLSNLYWQMGQQKKLLELIFETVAMESAPGRYFYESASKLLELRESDLATRVCKRALIRGVDPSMIRQLESDYPWYRFDSTSQRSN